MEMLHGNDYEEGKEKVDGELQADRLRLSKKGV